MEKKFREALLKVLADKTFKNESALCGAAGVDQGGVNAFIRTMKYRAGQCPEPSRIKDNMNLDIVSKLVDVMGGELVFPWDSPEANCHSQLKAMEQKIVEKETTIQDLKSKINILREVIKDLNSQNVQPDEFRQNKSFA